MTETLVLTVDGSPMRAHLNVPSGPGPFPAVVAMHPQDGLDTAFMAFCLERVPMAGFAVIAPDTYHHYTGTGTGMDERKATHLDTRLINDMAASVQALKSRPDVRTDAIFLMGFCMGGRMAYVGASAIRDFRAAAAFYSGNMFIARGDGPTAFERLKSIRCPIAGFYGNDDKNPSPADVDKISGELAKYGIAHQFHRYPHAGHGFANPARTEPKELAAGQDAWIKAFDFFRSQTAVRAAVAE